MHARSARVLSRSIFHPARCRTAGETCYQNESVLRDRHGGSKLGFGLLVSDRLLFFTDGLLEARDRAGRLFRVDQQIQALSRPNLQTAVDELLDRLRAHTRRTLDDDVAVLLAELTLTDPELQPVAPPPAARALRRAGAPPG